MHLAPDNLKLSELSKPKNFGSFIHKWNKKKLWMFTRCQLYARCGDKANCVCVFVCVCMCARSSSWSCSVVSDSLWPHGPGSSAHGISQARILEWVAVSFSRGSSQPSNWNPSFLLGRWILYHWATREAHSTLWTCQRLFIHLPSGWWAVLKRNFLVAI